MTNLVAIDNKTGQPIAPGDTVTDFRGETRTFKAALRARWSGGSGKIALDDRSPLYDKVIGCTVVDLDHPGQFLDGAPEPVAAYFAAHAAPPTPTKAVRVGPEARKA